MSDHVFSGEVVNGIGLIHVECANVRRTIVSFRRFGKHSASHQEFILRDGIFAAIDLQDSLKSIHTFLFDLVA